MESKAVANLLQRLGPGRIQEVELHEHEVRVHFRSATTESRRTIPLEVIDPNETTARAFPRWTWPIILIGAATAFLAGLGTAIFGESLGRGANAWTGGIAAAGAAAALGGLALHAWLAADTIYFYHGFTGEFLFAILQNRPDRQAAADFTSRLKELARKRYDQLKSDAERPSAAKELTALHELLEKKILSPDEFAQKKSELLDEVLRE